MNPRFKQVAIAVAVVLLGWIAGHYLGMGWMELTTATVVGLIIAYAAVKNRKI